jgi:nascent polypeptide-associated complex subunit alpha
MADTTPKVEEVTVEDVSSEEDMPGLEPTAAGEPAEGEPSVPKSKQSRSEKKSRKVVQRLGLKQVPGVIRVRVKKGKSVLIAYDFNTETTGVVCSEQSRRIQERQ